MKVIDKKHKRLLEWLVRPGADEWNDTSESAIRYPGQAFKVLVEEGLAEEQKKPGPGRSAMVAGTKLRMLYRITEKGRKALKEVA